MLLKKKFKCISHFTLKNKSFNDFTITNCSGIKSFPFIVKKICRACNEKKNLKLNQKRNMNKKKIIYMYRIGVTLIGMLIVVSIERHQPHTSLTHSPMLARHFQRNAKQDANAKKLKKLKHKKKKNERNKFI